MRFSLFAVGAIIVVYGLQLIDRGIFAYQNTWFRGTNYSAGTVATGVLLSLLAFLCVTIRHITRGITGRNSYPWKSDRPTTGKTNKTNLETV